MISFTVRSFPTVVIWMIIRRGGRMGLRLPVIRARCDPTTSMTAQTTGVNQAMRISDVQGLIGA